MPRPLTNTAAITLAAVVFLAWYYTDLIHIPFIDSGIRETADPERTSRYWWNYSAVQYIREALPWIVLARITSYQQRLQKSLFTFLSAMHIMALLDLLLTGNQAPTIWEPAIIIASIGYTIAVWLCCWRDQSDGGEIVPGRAYVISKPPRDMITLMGSILFRRWAGSVAIFVAVPGGGYYYHFPKPSNRWERKRISRPPTESRCTLINAPASTVKVEADKLLGSHWRLNCFETIRGILARSQSPA